MQITESAWQRRGHACPAVAAETATVQLLVELLRTATSG